MGGIRRGSGVLSLHCECVSLRIEGRMVISCRKEHSSSPSSPQPWPSVVTVSLASAALVVICTRSLFGSWRVNLHGCLSPLSHCHHLHIPPAPFKLKQMSLYFRLRIIICGGFGLCHQLHHHKPLHWNSASSLATHSITMAPQIATPRGRRDSLH